MRWWMIPLVACALAAPVIADDDDDYIVHRSTLRSDIDADRTTSHVSIDPVTGAKTTTTTTIRRYTDLYPGLGVRHVYGAPVVQTIASPVVVSAFPDNPFDGQRVLINGRTYEWDADDREWEEED